MEGTGHIYGLEDPRTGEIRYVGQTIQGLRDRLWEHICPSKTRAKTHKNSWIVGLRRLGLIPEIVPIQSLPISQLSKAEIFWISELRSRGYRLTNGTDGGEGTTAGKPRSFTEEGRKRCSENARRVHSVPVIEMTTGVLYPSAREAERGLNLYSNAVGRVLSGKQKQAAGYIFRRI